MPGNSKNKLLHKNTILRRRIFRFVVKKGKITLHPILVVYKIALPNANDVVKCKLIPSVVS